MTLNNLMNVINADFPDYKIINIEEIGIPIFKKNITCLTTINKSLSDVLEFTLKLVDLEYDIETIANMLALDIELIQHAIYDLDSMDMMDMNTHKVTEEGKKYLQKNSYDTLKRIILPINIDSYLGEVKEDKNFTSNKAAKNFNLNTIKPLLNPDNDAIIEPFKIKKILKDYAKKADSDIEAELVGIISIKKKSTQFMKVSLAVLESPANEIRYVVYNRNIKIGKLEQKIINADESGIQLFKKIPTEFFGKIKEPNLDANLVEYNDGSYIDPLSIEFFENDNALIDYVIPLINVYCVDQDWIFALERYLKRNLKVSIKLVGESFPNEFIKNRVLDLLSLGSRYPKLLKLEHNINYEYASIIINKKKVYLDKLELFNLSLKCNKETISHKTLEYNGENISTLQYPMITLDKYRNNNEIKTDIDKLIRCSKELDVLMEETYGLNWLISGQILNQAKLYDIKLAYDDTKFSEFTKLLTASVVEVISKVGESQGINNYMFNEFKQHFQKLFKALNRLRIYRNSMQHNELDSKNLKTYIEFITEDLSGQFPEFINEGYLHLQKLIIQEIIRVAEETINDLKAAYV